MFTHLPYGLVLLDLDNLDDVTKWNLCQTSVVIDVLTFLHTYDDEAFVEG
jgi:hypothetical protein